MVAEFARGQHLVQIDTEDIRVSADGDNAIVDARVRRRLVIGAGVTRLEGVERFTLQKRRGRWMIVSVPPLM